MTDNVIETTLQLWNQGRTVRKSSSGWLSGNAVCCQHRGHRHDKRGRAGFLIVDNQLTYSCFNCNFKTGYQSGSLLSGQFKRLLEWMGATETQIDKMILDSLRIRDEMGDILSKFSKKKIIHAINFDTINLPEYSELLDSDNDTHSVYVDYLKNRGLDPQEYPYCVTPTETGRNKDRIIVPYFYQDKIVGHTSRFLDDRKPKYISHQQRGYVFNIDAQQDNWSVCILVEGQFDALSINGCAYMGQQILDEQVNILNKLRRRIIVVPDRDETGMKICDRALELGYHVSIPEWNDDIKDVNDAVKKYGRLSTVLSILQCATSSKIKIEMLRKRFK